MDEKMAESMTEDSVDGGKGIIPKGKQPQGDCSYIKVGSALRADIVYSIPRPILSANWPASVRALYSILHTRYSRIAPCQLVNLPTGQLVVVLAN
jgi:hypothetical protein